MMFMPALRKAVSESTDEVFAPIVQMIAVCRNCEGRLYTSSAAACSSAEFASWLNSCRTVQALEPRFLLWAGTVSRVRCCFLAAFGACMLLVYDPGCRLQGSTARRGEPDAANGQMGKGT